MKCFRVILGLRCQILAQIDNWYIKHIKFCPIFSILSEPPWIFYICLDQGKTWLVHTVNGANLWRSHGSCKIILYSSSCRLLLSSISLSLSLSLSLRSHHPIIKNKKKSLGLSKLHVIPNKNISSSVHEKENLQLKNIENKHLCKIRDVLIRREKESRK